MFGLKDKTVKDIATILKSNKKIKNATLFGSRAKGDYRDGSDIDISLKADDLKLSELNILKIKIDNLMLPYKVDLIDFSKIKNCQLKEHINRVGKSII